MSQAMSSFAREIMNQKYSHDVDGLKETWQQIARRVVVNVLGAIGMQPGDTILEQTYQAVLNREFIPGGRYLYASGRPFHQTQNCLLLRAHDSREGWADLLRRSAMALMTGAGIGVDYSSVRERGAVIKKTGGLATGPCALMQILNETGRHVMQGGSRRSAIWAGLKWNHPDVMEFIGLKDWSDQIKAMKAKDFNFPAPMDGTNISVQLDDPFFAAYADVNHPDHQRADQVYWSVIRHMLETGEPGFSVDCGENANESLRNACTEITSEDDDDICNLGSINMARVTDRAHMTRLVRLGTLFLLAGTIYSDIPYAEVARTRTKNRRLGLGLMGVHEWLIMRGKRYAPDSDLADLLAVYQTSTEVAAEQAARLGITCPIKTRALAPNGTIGIVAETTTSGESMFCAAFKRRYLKGNVWHYQYVVDPTAKRAVESGINPADIEDAYQLAARPERRVAFQAWLQGYVDHAISSTINLPAWGTELNGLDTVRQFGDMLIKYLPRLRGITTYPDGSRGGQPLTPIALEVALAHPGEVFVEQQDSCDISKGGSCGS